MSRRLAQGFEGDAPRESASVTAVIAFGSNLGDRATIFAEAADDLRRMPLTSDVRVAPAIESVAIRVEGPDADAPAYLNTVALIATRLAPSILMSYLHAIEDRHGRERREQWGDRTLDLDLIAYGDRQIRTRRLTVPHPRAAERAFVLDPWLALDPDAELPGLGRVAELRAAIEDPS
ncbi:2-amino-4-hydroxy-6-hydroxymethyldihydropteridine diphosphokinase [Microbacterium sp. cx-55]|uniref:2-amino-4-hydroxy-6- hydroxymethyldihydropteridine diphosphokinase n=1 Tax=Microbacterium sp. cx-55 TaxID=2875948 RepID=UPI001CBB5947|nr:2-amino-4-hydroxy-6-hydroxymethyldihydropteridine diphosphokinase [Microbacterium sp. cx-55]MBZ4487428.1 2-amino-4-hydroxy-6-hydroxymethyldihydropteridine diphosphokinase [Microbacterium sp. cx-55]UGB35448.1 2-amino-4-hydroxy-6-hydroxymethyldihydropteridine diphosphokinase [Microbacterium sp. cx-55]